MTNEAEKMQGTVKFFNERKGYGFISVDGGADYFAHESQLVGEFLPNKNDRVEFVPDKGGDGRPYARKIVIIDGS
jgi:CspA family cold shock protein